MEPKFCAQAWWFSHMPGSKCAFRRDETAIFASAPRTWRVAAPLASSGRFLPFSKTKKTLGPFAQKVLRPPAGAPRRPMCVLYCVLQHELASGLRILGFFIGFREAVPGPPKRPPKRLPGARAPKPPAKSPPRGRKCVCYRVLQSKLASGLKNLRFFNGFRPPRGQIN